MVSVPQGSGAPSFWQVPIAAPSTTGGAVWATAGPAVDGTGTVYASTGNPNPPSGQEATTYDYSDSVVQLNPALGLIGHFEPPTWQHDSNADLDLSSAAPELLPGGLLFQAGKTGTGYLIDEASLPSARRGGLQPSGLRRSGQLRRRLLCRRCDLHAVHERRAGARL